MILQGGTDASLSPILPKLGTASVARLRDLQLFSTALNQVRCVFSYTPLYLFEHTVRHELHAQLLIVLNFPSDIAYPRFDSRMAQRLRHAFLSIIYSDRDNRLGESDNGEKRLEPEAHAITIARVERPVVRQCEKKFVQAFSIEEMRKTV